MLRDIVQRNRRGEQAGIYAVCSAHPSVISAAIQQAVEDGSVLLVESTSSQVNQFGGYTGQTPDQFARLVRSAAARAGLPRERVLLGGDHLGPYPWREHASEAALLNACDLVRSCVLAGYHKIHLDASMACADDGTTGLDEHVVARRAAVLCRAAEAAHAESPASSAPRILYVVGTEVPVPGGETAAGHAPAITAAENVPHTMEVFQKAFEEQGVSSAWENVIGIVVQPGVEFGEDVIFDYDHAKATALASALPQHPELVYEAHSTDYQSPTALRQMVADHFAILKAGPWLTFGFREAVFALSAIEQELFAQQKGVRTSRVREALDAAMLRNPAHWQSYYREGGDQQRLMRAYSYSDRCRYYWIDTKVQEELARLYANLDSCVIPSPLWSQYLPSQYEALRSGRPSPSAEGAIQEHVRGVLRVYAAACGR